MNSEREVGQVGGKSVANPAASSEDARSSTLHSVTSIIQTSLGSTGAEMLGPHAESGVFLLSSASGEVHITPSSSDFHASTIGGATTSPKSLSISSSVVEETTHAAESSARNPTVLIGDIANTTGIGSAEDIKGKPQALVLTRLRAIVFVCAAKLPIVGSYFLDAKRDDEPNTDASATEITPLLGALQDPKAFATEQTEGLLLRLFSPLLSRIPDVDALDNAESDNHGPLFRTFVECYALARNGSGWLLWVHDLRMLVATDQIMLDSTHLQEHSLVIAPTVSLGHLSTTDLAASTIGTAVTSITGYSIIQGFIRSVANRIRCLPMFSHFLQFIGQGSYEHSEPSHRENSLCTSGICHWHRLIRKLELAFNRFQWGHGIYI